MEISNEDMKWELWRYMSTLRAPRNFCLCRNMDPFSAENCSELYDNLQNIGGFQYESSMENFHSFPESSLLSDLSIYSPKCQNQHTFSMPISSCETPTHNTMSGIPASTWPQVHTVGSNMSDHISNTPASPATDVLGGASILNSPVSVEGCGMSTLR